MNYSIAANEDIVDYIKYDIILEFLRKGQDFEEKDYTYLDTLPSYLKKDLLSVAKILVSMIPDVGKDVVEMHEKIVTLWERFEKYHEEANIFEGTRLDDYVTGIEQKKGSPYAIDIVTKIIQRVVNQEDTDSILIIDDLDRLDPEHIFRLLNIFSVHLGDHSNEIIGNKFGFKKVIIVCDYNNIRHLFHHRYGQHTDFSGYIDKFYSTSVFHFDNRAAIISIIERILDSFTYPKAKNESKIAQQMLLQDRFLYEILTVFIENRFISLRSVAKQYNKPIDLHYKEINLGPQIALLKGSQIRIAMQLGVLTEFISDEATLDRAIANGLHQRIAFDGQDLALGQLVMLINYPAGQYLMTTKSGPFQVEWHDTPYLLKFNRSGNQVQSAYLYRIVSTEGEQTQTLDHPVNDPVLFWTALKEVLVMLRQLRFIP